MKKNKVNYKKGLLRIDRITGVFERTNAQDCSKCLFYEKCEAKRLRFCCPSFGIDDILPEPISPFGRGHFVKKKSKLAFPRALANAETGDLVRIEGADEGLVKNGIYSIQGIQPTSTSDYMEWVER